MKYTYKELQCIIDLLDKANLVEAKKYQIIYYNAIEPFTETTLSRNLLIPLYGYKVKKSFKQSFKKGERRIQWLIIFKSPKGIKTKINRPLDPMATVFEIN